MDGVPAKCALWNYKPWSYRPLVADSKFASASVARDYHQTCTRAARADYCGDGTPHTQAGHPIQIWDPLGAQTFRAYGAGDYTYHFEAAWGPNGAVCINDAERIEHDSTGSCAGKLYATGLPYDNSKKGCRYLAPSLWSQTSWNGGTRPSWWPARTVNGTAYSAGELEELYPVTQSTWPASAVILLATDTALTTI